jgi:hypothetical protein
LALLVAEELYPKTFVPDYILEAIAFTCAHLSDQHFEKMADFRIQTGIEYDGSNSDYQTVFEIRERLKEQNLDRRTYVQEYMRTFKEILPEDQLTLLLTKMGM